MHGRFQQVQPEPWPSGYGAIVGVLETSPELLSARHGLSFFDGTDNLDDYRAAAIQLPSGRRVAMIRHAGAPPNAVEIHADAHDDPATVIDELLGALDLPRRKCTWLRHGAGVPASR